MRPVRGVARALLGGLFIAAGSQALLRPGRHAALAQPMAKRVAPMIDKLTADTALEGRVPTEAKALVRVNAAVQIGAGLMLATGTAPRPAAALLAGTLLPSTVVGHPFWQFRNSDVRRVEAVQFAKNLGLLAGLLLAAADTAGSPSLHWRANHAMASARKKIQDN